MNRVFVLLGSNIEKEKNMPTAVSLLRQSCQVVAMSAVYESKPVGLQEQPNFWNTAVLLQTPLSPHELREQVLHPIEQQLQRQRTADKNAPRTIDLDIVLFNDQIIDDAQHHIPDPDLLRFAHVAIPVAELAPAMQHPETGEPLAAIAGQFFDPQTGLPPIWQVTLCQGIK